MMSKLLSEIILSFCPSNSATICEVRDAVKVDFETEKEKIPNYNKFVEILSQIPDRDRITVTFSNEADETSSVGRDTLEIEYESKLGKFDTDDLISVCIEINKTICNNALSIYDYKRFCEWLSSRNFLQILESFASIMDRKEFMIFELFDSSENFSTGGMIFSSATLAEKRINNSRLEKLENVRQTSSFSNEKFNKLLPDDFHIVMDYAGNPLTEIFKKIETLLSIMYLADYVHIEDEKIYLQIVGQRKRDYICDLEIKDFRDNLEFYRIYNWVYTEGNSIDKIGIARNIISLHCKHCDLFEIDRKTFSSIQSNFSIYQKKNVENYLELKNKLADFIIELVDKTTDLIDGLSDGLKKNMIAFFSFFLTVFLVNIISESPLEDILTRDITYLIYLMLFFSVIYLIISVNEINTKKRRIRKGYNNLQENYKEILDDSDLKEIFKEDKIIKKSLDEIIKRRKRIIFLWVFVVLFIGITVSILSRVSLVGEFVNYFNNTSN